MIRLSAFFSDGMVLQREPFFNKIWGAIDSETVVTVRLYRFGVMLEEVSSRAVFLEDEVPKEAGFEAELSPQQAGRGYRLVITSGEESITIDDVLFGDVYVCGGQSNMELPISRTMELYEEEIHNTSEDEIREFRVNEKYNFHHTEKYITDGSWRKAEGDSLLNFSAAAYFAADSLHRSKGVPIGIYSTAIGGTPIKSWVSMETTERLGLHMGELLICRDDEMIRATLESEAREDQNWRRTAYEPYEDGIAYSGEETGSLTVPGFFEGTSLGGRCFSLSVRRNFHIPQALAGKMAKLYLGAIIDADMVYINRECVGETGYLYPPRIYPVREGLIHEGENEIEIRMAVFRRSGGFMPDMRYELYFPQEETSVSLKGEWDYKVVRNMPYIENMTFFSYKASGVYNGMIHPLGGLSVRGIFFYQGESNVEEYALYKKEFTACVEDWRRLFGNDKLPFIYVQIAEFTDGGRDKSGKWQLFREMQKELLEIPYTAMVETDGLGEYYELHPANKKEIGRRLAEEAEKLCY